MKIGSKENKLGHIYSNISFVFVDVLESVLMNAKELLRKDGFELRHESKQNFNTAISAIRKLKGHVNKCSSDTQECFGNDADMLYATIMLLIDRCGDDDMKLFQFYNYIKSHPSKFGLESDDSAFSHIFENKTKDQ